jgi:hypothetical protein
VRLVAGIAGLATTVFSQYNLRKILRLGRIRFVAASAKINHCRQCRFLITHHLNMLVGRSVAGFARDGSVLALAFQCHYRFVTGCARLVARVPERAIPVIIQSAGTEMTVPAKVRRHQDLPQHQKGDQCAGECRRQPAQMCGVMGDLPHGCNL